MAASNKIHMVLSDDNSVEVINGLASCEL